MKNTILYYLSAVILIISFLFTPISILLITHSTVSTVIAVMFLVWNILLFICSAALVCKCEKRGK